MAGTITKEELREMMDKGEKFVLLDVRDTPDYENEHITGAVHLLIPDMEEKAQSLFEKDELVITYSEDFDCPASTIAARKLEKMGYRALDYKGSFKDWKNAGYPTLRA